MYFFIFLLFILGGGWYAQCGSLEKIKKGGGGKHLQKILPDESHNNKKSFYLKFINEQVIPHHFKWDGIPVGGLSAVTYDPTRHAVLALSDDKGHKGPPRFYELSLHVSQPPSLRYRLQFKNQVFLQKKPGLAFLPIDPEGMFLHPENQQVFISSEGAQVLGHAKKNILAPPALLIFNRQGVWQSSWPLPYGFWPEDLKKLGQWGVPENKAFEALSLDPNKPYFYLATEAPLHQDKRQQPSSTPSPIQYIRINRVQLDTQKLVSQWLYPLRDTIYHSALKGKNGLTDFLSLGNKKFLVIERAYLKNPLLKQARKQDFNLVRLFLVNCQKASNVMNYPSVQTLLKQKTWTPCTKKQVLDMSSLLGKKAVQNVEGITLGPLISPNQRLVILVSDNNFNPAQKTQFLFFHYVTDSF